MTEGGLQVLGPFLGLMVAALTIYIVENWPFPWFFRLRHWKRRVFKTPHCPCNVCRGKWIESPFWGA